MKVALVADRFDAGGGGLERWTWQFARHLLGRDHEVHVVARAFDGEELPVRRHLVRCASRRPAAVARAVGRALAGLAVDLVHDSGIGWSADLVQTHGGCRLTALERELEALPPGRRWRLRLDPRLHLWRRQLAAVERRQLARAGRIVAVSRMVKEDLQRRYGVPEERLVVIPNGVDLARFGAERLHSLRDGARRRLGAGGRTVFLTVARNYRLKGVHVCLEALAVLAREGHDAHLAVAGAGPVEEYERLAGALAVDERVTFLGEVAEMDALYAAADVSLHPTFYDACALATLEALACGLPVLTTSANGASELIRAPDEGLVLERAGEAGEVAAGMRLLLDPERRARMGAAGRRRARALDLGANFRRVEDAYEVTLAARGARASS